MKRANDQGKEASGNNGQDQSKNNQKKNQNQKKQANPNKNPDDPTPAVLAQVKQHANGDLATIGGPAQA